MTSTAIDHDRTCLVLGAGVSASCGYPLGGELKTILSKPGLQAPTHRAKDGLALRRLLEDRFDADHVNAFQRDLRESPRETVDSFLGCRQEYEQIGEYALAAVLHHYDKQFHASCKDAVRNRLYSQVYRALIPNPKRCEYFHPIITFNYDCSLEHFIARGLRADTGMSSEDAWDTVQRLGILHVHGSLDSTGATWPLTRELLDGSAKRIRVIHESVMSDAQHVHLLLLQNAVRECNTIVFLGFGFDQRNVKLLRISDSWPPGSNGELDDHPPPPKKTVYGSCFQMTDREIEAAIRGFSVDCKISPGHKHLNAVDFLAQTDVLAPMRSVIRELSQ